MQYTISYRTVSKDAMLVMPNDVILQWFDHLLFFAESESVSVSPCINALKDDDGKIPAARCYRLTFICECLVYFNFLLLIAYIYMKRVALALSYGIEVYSQKNYICMYSNMYVLISTVNVNCVEVIGVLTFYLLEYVPQRIWTRKLECDWIPGSVRYVLSI